ncbi:MAG: hypothetical protein HY063_08130 [Bacteroidetes bacterium]|nr:hypothetical protein [Bacteroidota bacterium]
MKKLFLFSCFLFFTSYIFSQVDLGLPGPAGKGGVANGIAKDWECIGINPSNLGWENNYKFSLSLLTFGISAQSKALDYNQLKNALTHPNDTFSAADKKVFAGLFTDKDGLNLQSNLNWLSFSFAVPKVGGFAMNVRDRTFGHVRLNQNAADILFMGENAPIFHDTMFWLNPKNISQVFDGSKISFLHYREMNFAYGAKILGIGGTKDSSAISIYGGIGFKYLWGMADMEMIASNGVLTGHSAFTSNYGINYDSVRNFNPVNTSGIFPSVGNGTAFDLGAGIGIGKLKITFSAIDMGSIHWNKNVLVAQDTLLPDTSKFKFQGINSWNLQQTASDMFNKWGIIKFKPGSPYTTQLPSKFRLGASYRLTRRMLVGADMVMPLSSNPTNLEKAFFAVGTDMALANTFRLSFGFAGNPTYGFSLPMGVTLSGLFRIMEVSVGTGDVLTYLSHGSNPNISLAVSILRFNVAGKK